MNILKCNIYMFDDKDYLNNMLFVKTYIVLNMCIRY